MTDGEWIMVEPGGVIRLSEPLKQELSIVDGDMVFVVVKRPTKARSDAALAAICAGDLEYVLANLTAPESEEQAPAAEPAPAPDL
jgi:hypothetical protein